MSISIDLYRNAALGNRLDGAYPLGDGTVGGLDAHYLPSSTTFISWDFPNVVATGIDVDYKMTGYDWSNRTLGWTIDSGPAGMTIGSDGTIHWTPSVDSTTEAVTVGLTFDGGSKITKSFTITVENSRCRFVSTTGNDTTGDGTNGNPYATLNKAASDLTGAGTGFTIYMGGGTYSVGTADFASNLYDHDTSVVDPYLIRNIPTESPVFNSTLYGFTAFGDGCVRMGLKVDGGSNTESGGFTCWGNVQAIKLCEATNYDTSSADFNPCGFQLNGGVIVDSCTAANNYATSATGSSFNNANFLWYGDRTGQSGQECFIIDCISDSIGANYTGVGYKVKHAGGARLHIHNSVDINSLNSIRLGQQGASARYCMFASDEAPAVFTFGGADFTTDDGALVQHNVIATTNGYLFNNDSPKGTVTYPTIIDNNTFETTVNLRGSVWLEDENLAGGTYVNDFDNNDVYAAFPNNCYSISQVGDTLTNLLATGANNTALGSTGTHTKTINGRTFQVLNAVGSEI